MHANILFATASALFAVAQAVPQPPTPVIAARQSVVTPPPCEAIDPPPSAAETEERFNEFADAFLVEKNLTHAFEFISSTYINHNPAVTENGPNAALDVLGPVWGSVEIEVLRTKYIDPQGFLNYNTSGFGEVVDRFRWEAGCIVEHWDAGEVFPGDTPATNTTPTVGTSNGSASTSNGSSTFVPVSEGAKRPVMMTTAQSVATTAFMLVLVSYLA